MQTEKPFCIRLAGRTIKISPLHPYLRTYCRAYLTEPLARPDVTITISEDDVAFEWEKSRREDERQGRPVRPFPDDYLETLAAYRKIAVALLDYDTLLFHGSCIAVDGAGYLFAAPSGTGKSTHARLWRELFGERTVMVNDDKPLLKVTEQGVTAYGTPWDGKHRLSTNTAVPLHAVCFLNRGETNHIAPVDFWTAFPLLLRQTYRPEERDAMEKTLLLLEKAASQVRLYTMDCNLSQDAAKVAYHGMK